MQAEVVMSDSITAVDAAYQVSRLMYEPHIYKELCDEYKDLYYAHWMLVEIEQGVRAVILLRENNIVVGCVHGMFEAGGDFVCHIMFKRQINALAGCLLAEEALKKFCSDNNMPFKRVIGHIRNGNRTALKLARNYGSVDHGISEKYIWKDGYLLPCRKMIKEIK